MALSRDDLTYDKGNIGYGTMESLPEPTEGSAGDLAAEAATAGIVNTDASAELAQQVPNIVVPVNQSSDTVDRNIDFETGDITGSTTGDINIYDEAALTGGATNTGGLETLTDKLPDSLKPSLAGLALNFAVPGLGFLYNYIMSKREEQKTQNSIDQQIESLETTGSTYNQQTGETTSNLTPQNTQGSMNAGTDIDYTTGDITDSRTGDVNVYNEFYDSGPSTPITGGTDLNDYTAPAPAPTYTYYDGGSDSDNDSGGSFGGSGQETQDNMYASGGIVRLRKNKQNTRIHDRRKRLAMGGITSLHG